MSRPRTAGCVIAGTITPEKVPACAHGQIQPSGRCNPRRPASGYSNSSHCWLTRCLCQQPLGPAPLFLLDLARAKSGRACPSGGRRVRARPVRRGRISQPLRKRITPCLRACALRQRPGGPSTGRSADRAGAMRRPLCRLGGFIPPLRLGPRQSRDHPENPRCLPAQHLDGTLLLCWIWPAPNPAAPALPGAGAFAPARPGAAGFPSPCVSG